MAYDYFMNPDAVEEMINRLEGMCDQLQVSIAKMGDVAERMEGGTLKGNGGKAFGAAIGERGTASISRFDAYLRDLINELRTAIQAHDDTTEATAGRFTGR